MYPQVKVREARTLARKWLAEVENLRGCEVANKSPLGAVLEEILLHVRPTKLPAMSVAEVAAEFEMTFVGLHPVTDRNYRRYLRNIVGYFDDLTIEEVTAKRYKLRKRESLTKRQREQLVGELAERLRKPDPTHSLLAIAVILSTGERAGACVSLRVEEVDFAQKVIRKVRKGEKVESISDLRLYGGVAETNCAARGLLLPEYKSSRTCHYAVLIEVLQKVCRN